MNRILYETHKKENIDYLKVRDYYFDKARWINRGKRVFILIPIIVLALSYIPIISKVCHMDTFRDYVTGIVSIVSYIIVIFVNKKIEEYVEISNIFREEYDVQVFDIRRNNYLYNQEKIDKYIDKALKYVNGTSRYQVWYDEVFCDNHNKNVICCQMDNVLYTSNVYKKTKKVYNIFAIVFLVIVVIVFIVLIVFYDIESAILIMIALFGAVQWYVEYIVTAKSLIKEYEYVYNQVLNEDVEEYDEEDIRIIQDVIYYGRNKAQFIPNYIRRKFLNNMNLYYEKLGKIKKKLYANENVYMPSNATEIEALSCDGQTSTNLEELHSRLSVMMKDVKEVFDINNIHYTLDGGTLIGAIRENGKYIFWDDDIDIAIKYEDFEHAKKCLREKLLDKYELQDYYNDTFYSPRLSSLRIREKNTESMVYENDSALYELYEKRGLFIDVYVYSPILVNKLIDGIHRKLWFHKIHKRMFNIEKNWKKNKTKYEKAFKKYKRIYLRRLDWYLKHAKNTAYYAYTPNYIYNLSKAGPYIEHDALYGEKKTIDFEGMNCTIPTKHEIILEAFYGKNWNVSPYIPLEKLEKYSDKKFFVTNLKHISYFDNMRK